MSPLFVSVLAVIATLPVEPKAADKPILKLGLITCSCVPECETLVLPAKTIEPVLVVCIVATGVVIVNGACMYMEPSALIEKLLAELLPV